MTRHPIVALLGALALLLGGCVADTRRPPTTSDISVPATAPASATTRPIATTTTTTEPSTTTAATAPTTTTESLLGPITILEAGSGQPVLVGGMLPLFGEAGDIGGAQADAVQLAVENFGDIYGHDVLLAPFEDSRCTVDGGRAAARSIVSAGPIIAGSPVVGLIGPSCAAAAIEGVPLLTDAGFTVVAPTVTDPAFTSDLAGNPGGLQAEGFFRVAPNPLALGDAAGRFVLEYLGSRRVAVVVVEGSTSVGDLFTRTVEARGGEVAATITLAEDTRGARTAMRALIDVEPDAIFIALEPEAAARILRTLRTIQPLESVDRVLFGVPRDDPVVALEEEASTYYVTFDEVPSGRDAKGERFRDVSADYERAFGRPPSPAAMRAYDATMLLLTAVAAVAEDRDGSVVIDRRAIPTGMREVGVRGFFGWLECDAFGDCLDARSMAYREGASLGETLANEVWTNG